MAIFDKTTFVNLDRDIKDVGHAANNMGFVRSRLGMSYKTIPQVVADGEQKIEQAAEDIVAATGAILHQKEQATLQIENVVQNVVQQKDQANISIQQATNEVSTAANQVQQRGDQAIAELNNAINIAAAAGAGANGWTDKLVAMTDGGTLDTFAEKQKKNKIRDNETIYDYGAIGDGVLHTVEEWYTVGATNYKDYANLAAVQADYPFVTDKDFSIDQAAILKLINLKAQKGGGSVDLSQGEFIVKPVEDGACLNVPQKVTLIGHYEDTIIHEITPVNDAPAESVWWDTILFTGSDNVGGGAKNITFKHTGGRRNNTCTIAVRGGASRKKITGNIFENSIGSNIGIEGSVANPINTKCKIHGNSLTSSARHNIYFSGSRGNTVTQNDIYISALEAIQNRNSPDNIVELNNFYGVSGVQKSAIMFTQPPTTESKSYVIDNYSIINNQFFDLRAAAVSGGVGVVNNFAKIKNNTIYLSDDTTTTEHALSLFRFNNSDISENYIKGGRNRAIALYGCKDNRLHNNVIKDVMSAVSSGGVIQFQAHTDSIDSTVTNSTGNKITGGSIIDDRETVKHVHAVNFLADNIHNIVSKVQVKNTVSGVLIASADGLNANKIGETYASVVFPVSKQILGTVAAKNMQAFGGGWQYKVIQDSFIQSMRINIGQLTVSGLLRCRIYKNGNTFTNIVFNADNSSRQAETFLQLNQLQVLSGDLITATFEMESLISNVAEIDFSLILNFAE